MLFSCLAAFFCPVCTGNQLLPFAAPMRIGGLNHHYTSVGFLCLGVVVDNQLKAHKTPRAKISKGVGTVSGIWTQR